MKNLIPLFSLALLVLSQHHTLAQNENGKQDKNTFEKTKSYSKSYSVSSSDRIDIKNKFGAVDIHVWNKNEIKVDVVIKTTAQTEEWAASVLNDIQVEDAKEGNTISFKTLFSEDLDKKENKINGKKRIDKYKGKDARQTTEVNYTIYMPASNPLTIANEFGPTSIPDYSGQVDLSSKFGSLTAGALKNIKKIEVEFGEAILESIANGAVTVRYSSAEIRKLIGNVKLNFEFCSATKINIDNNLTALDLKASYSTVNL